MVAKTIFAKVVLYMINIIHIFIYYFLFKLRMLGTLSNVYIIVTEQEENHHSTKINNYNLLLTAGFMIFYNLLNICIYTKTF